jgi:hypothetical protein
VDPGVDLDVVRARDEQGEAGQQGNRRRR